MSWHKAELSARVTWIGWAFDFEHFVVQLDPAKLARLLALLRQLQSSPKCTVTVLEKRTGKLLWLSNLFSALRPSLAPPYLDQHNPVPNMCASSRNSGFLSAPLCRLSSAWYALYRLRPYPWAASFYATPIHLFQPCQTCPRSSHPVGSGCRLPTPFARIANCLPNPARYCACGLISARHVLHALFPSPSLQICSLGSRPMPHRSIALPPGRCWSKLDFCGLCPSFFRLGMSPFT